MREPQAEKYRRWRNRIDVGYKWLKNQSQDWQKFRDAYDGTILSSEKSDFKDLCSVNLQYVDVRSSIPKLYNQNPYAYIDPETTEADLFAEIMERVVNAQMDVAWQLKRRMRDAIKAAKVDGRSYIKVSYKFDKDKIGRDYMGNEPNDEISISVVLRKNLIIPRDCTSVADARWVIHRVEDQIGNIRAKFKLKDKDKPTVVEDKMMESCDHMSDEEKEDFRYGCYYEIEDRVERTLSIVVDGVDRLVVPPYDFPYKFYTMYEPIEWNNLPGDNDTRADLHFWWRQLQQLAEEETMRVNHCRKLNSKYIHRGPNEPSPELIEAVTSYKDSRMIHLEVNETIDPLVHATLGQEHYLGGQSTRQDIMIISAMNEMKQGLSQSTKTAREAMAIVAEAQDVIGDRASLIEDAVANVISKCIVLIQQFYDTTRVVALTGMEQAEFIGLKDRSKGMVKGDYKRPFISFVGTKLVGKMRVRIKAGSAQPVDENQRKQDFRDLIELAASNPIVAAAIDPKEALKEFAKIIHVENKGLIIDPKAPEQENALLKRDIPVMPNISENHEEHIAKHERENNGSDAFVMHLLGHKLLKSFVGNSQLQAPVTQRAEGLSQDNISGVPQGSSVPPGAMPQQVGGMMPQPQPPSGLPN